MIVTSLWPRWNHPIIEIFQVSQISYNLPSMLFTQSPEPQGPRAMLLFFYPVYNIPLNFIQHVVFYFFVIFKVGSFWFKLLGRYRRIPFRTSIPSEHHDVRAGIPRLRSGGLLGGFLKWVVPLNHPKVHFFVFFPWNKPSSYYQGVPFFVDKKKLTIENPTGSLKPSYFLWDVPWSKPSSYWGIPHWAKEEWRLSIAIRDC